MTAFSGVRSSWLIVEKKSIFELAGAFGFFFCVYQGCFHSPALANLVSDNNAVNGEDEKKTITIIRTRRSMKTLDVICTLIWCVLT